MQNNWPKDHNIMNWDPENMEKYWELCRQYDQYPQCEFCGEEVSSLQVPQHSTIKAC